MRLELWVWPSPSACQSFNVLVVQRSSHSTIRSSITADESPRLRPKGILVRRIPRLGPGLLVTAAFIGPGTVTTASRAGASAGFALLWAVIFSVVAAVVLQEMSARLGLVARKSLGEAATDLDLPEGPAKTVCRFIIGGLILAAIAFGNAAYQTGNLAGAAGGVLSILPDNDLNPQLVQGLLVLTMVILAGAILFIGKYRWIERILIAMVITMSLLFMITAILARPDFSAILSGTFRPSMTKDQVTTVIGLIGTTVVPYNLFLHSQSVQERWKSTTPETMTESRLDTAVSIGLGGIVTAAIVIASAAAFFPNKSSGSESIGEMARQLEPTVGPAARWLFGLGLMAAGLTSSITAPLAAAYATCGVLRWKIDAKSTRFRAIWISVLVIGGVVAFIGSKQPVAVIRTAQVANGLLLPGLALLLIWTVNRTRLMGQYKNGPITNGIAGVVVFVISSLTLYKLATAIMSWFEAG